MKIKENDTWKLVPLPVDRTPLPCKWVFRHKYISGSKQPKYKARSVAKGLKQEQGIEYNTIFSPIIKLKTLRL